MVEIPDEKLAEMAEQLAEVIQTLNLVQDHCKLGPAAGILARRARQAAMDCFNIRRELVYVYNDNSPLKGVWPR